MSYKKRKEYVSEYNVIASKFIRDERLSLEIQQNISFVENYVDKVDEAFDEEVEREIVYRELGVIVFSCIEALLKTVLFEIDGRCTKRKCKDKACKYWRYQSLSDINNEGVIDALTFLINTRLFMLFPNEIDELTKLNTKRNYVHISKKIGKKKLDIKFDKEYPFILLKYYYTLLDQLDLCDFYFGKDDTCLKELDSDGFDDTNKMHKNDISHYYLKNFLNAIRKVSFKECLSKDDELYLKRYQIMDNECQEMALRYATMVLRPMLCKNIDDDEYVKTRSETIDKLSKTIGKRFVKRIQKEI